MAQRSRTLPRCYKTKTRWLQASSFRETLRAVRVSPLIGLAVLGVACSEPPPTTAPVLASSVFSADAGMGLSAVEGFDAGPSFAKEPEPGVLGEIVAAVPKKTLTATDPDGGTLIGTETGVKESEVAKNNLGSKDPAPKAKSAMVESGPMEVQALSPHGVERMARAQIYHSVVTRCRDSAGRILPADAIVLGFRIDEEGTIVPSSISAIANDPKHENAANCMRRELSAVAFRGLAASRGTASKFTATVPSVD